MVGTAAFADGTTGWVLAAEKFEINGVPAIYGSVSSAVPSLLLSRLLAIRSRKVTPDEKKTRDLSALSTTRVQLVKDRATLMLARDKVLLETETSLTKKKDLRSAETKIAAKEKDIAELDKKIGKLSASVLDETSSENVTLWESGQKLYTRTPGVSLGKSLADSKISGLVTGKVEDIAGYLHVTASIETGIADLPAVTVSEAAPYDELDALVASLAARLMPGLSERNPVSIILSVEPQTAAVFIDSRRIEDFSVPVTVFSGEHRVSVSAEGYESSYRSHDFSGTGSYRVSISLRKASAVYVAFDTKGVPLSLYFRTKYLGESPLSVTLPAIAATGEAIIDDNRTFFILDLSRLADGSSVIASIKPNKVSTQTRIEKQRTLFYWSLAALYASLPVSMLSYGIAQDKYNAYESGKLDQTQDNVNDVNNWMRTSTISRGVSIGLGINVAIQLVRYLLAAEQAIPQQAIITGQESGEN
jgi:hypothetical protein